MVNHFRMNKNSIMRTSGISRMLVLFAFLIVSGISTPLFAQSVWSGNASVDPSEFINFMEDFPLAGASSSFTRNTKIVVTNPQNDKTVEITIVKRAPRPGVFLVLSEEAGNALSIPSGQIIPVQVQVVNTGSTSVYDEFRSTDPDINPALSVPAVDEAVADVEPSSPDILESDAIPELGDEGFSAVPLSGEDVVPVPVPGDSLRLEREESDPIADAVPPEEELMVVPVVVEMTEPEMADPSKEVLPESGTISEKQDSEKKDEEEPIVLTEEDEIRESLLPAGDNVIYFLTPSDFRPPTGPVDVVEEKEEIIPVLVDRSSLETFIVNQLKNGSSYIQLGAYTSPESIYEEITSIEARYPMVVWTENNKDETLYKLLIGPLTGDETGVLSYRFRSSGYSDLFLYKP